MDVKAGFNDNQLKILRSLYIGDRYEYIWGFWLIQDETGLDKKTISKEIKPMRDRGYVEYFRGGIGEDGMTTGSGYSIVYRRLSEIRDILLLNKLIEEDE